MKKLLCIFILLILLPLSFAEIDINNLIEKSENVLNLILESKDEEALLLMEEKTQALIKDKLGLLRQIQQSIGKFVKADKSFVEEKDGSITVKRTIYFENALMSQHTSFNQKGEITGLFITQGATAAPSKIPENITQTDVVVDAKEGYPLNGKICLQKDRNLIAAVVLISGSGPSDMNESVGANKPFEDLAFGLAKHGIASLRYDKRTFAHGAKMKSASLKDEYITDARFAIKLMKERYESLPLYLIGHSQGAMLAPYIAKGLDEVEGYVLLSGTPRKLWELVYDQQMLLAKEQDIVSGGIIKTIANDMKSKAEKLLQYSDEEIKSLSIFGMPASYLKELDEIDSISIMLSDKKPVLILQGELDRQVGILDFELYKEGLKNHPNAKFISYPKLNHLLGEYTGEAMPFSKLVSAEYSARTPVDSKLIEDIADFIKK